MAAPLNIAGWVDLPLTIRNAHGKNLSNAGANFAQSDNAAGWETWVLRPSEGGTVFISCPEQKSQISASDNRTTVNPTPNSDAWERWTVLDAGGGKVYFRSFHGAHLSQSDTGALSQSPNAAGWEQFELRPAGLANVAAWAGKTLVIRNAHSQNLRMLDGDHRLEHSPNDGGWENWYLAEAGPGQVFITNVSFNLQLSASDNRSTVTASPNRDAWERWTVIEAGGGKVNFRSAHGTQLSQADTGALTQSPNRAGWEQFQPVEKAAPVPAAAAAPAPAAGGQADSGCCTIL